MFTIQIKIRLLFNHNLFQNCFYYNQIAMINASDNRIEFSRLKCSLKIILKINFIIQFDAFSGKKFKE